VISAALGAAARRVRIRLLLDPAALPNRTVAGELRQRAGDEIDVRWMPHGSPMSSLVIVRHGRELSVNVGAADLTRLSLGDLNLSAAVDFRLQDRAAAAHAFMSAFEAEWSASMPDASLPPADPPGVWSYRVLQAAGLAAY
jgi:hypothetical protein